MVIVGNSTLVGFRRGQGEEETVQVVAIGVVEAERDGPACGMPDNEVRVP